MFSYFTMSGGGHILIFGYCSLLSKATIGVDWILENYYSKIVDMWLSSQSNYKDFNYIRDF